mgnify:CR=1 FL=1
MSNDNFVLLMVGLVAIIVLIIVILIIVNVSISMKEKRLEKERKNKDSEKKQVKKSEIIYTPESIIDFMDFERIEDNMIIQKKGKFLMVVECQGINYDLMSEMEKVSVEQGFTSFLNTLRHPVQLYIQTRTINLERSIQGYKSKLKEIEMKYLKVQDQYESMLKDNRVALTEIEKMKYELVKQKNLKEYTEDIIRDIERQSLNRSILSKRYYVIIPCYQSEIEAGDFSKTEIRDMAFAELYTRARAVINSLFACQVIGKVLNSEELTELLYIAYNRDESDLFWMEKIRKAGFDELYSTAPDAIDKKIKMLNKKIEDDSISLANKKISEARRDKEIRALEMEKNEEKYVKEKAKELIKKHKRYIGEEVADRAVEKIDEEQKNTAEEEKEEIEDGIVQEKGKRGRTRRKA